jgi:hypothetical protein
MTEEEKSFDDDPFIKQSKVQVITQDFIIPQFQVKMKAYALLRLPGKDIPLTTKEAYLGRDPTDIESELAKQVQAP